MKKLVISIMFCSTITPIWCAQTNIITQLREREIGLRRYIEIPNYETFQTIKKIRAIIADILPRNYHPSRITLGEYTQPYPNAYMNQTEKGFYLFFSNRGTCFLASPMGRVMLYKVQAELYMISSNYKNIFDRLRKRLTLKFVRNEGEGELEGGERFRVGQAGMQLTENDLNKFRGTSANIWVEFTRQPKYSIYEITAMDGAPLPKPKFLPINQFRSPNDIKAEWDRLTAISKIMHPGQEPMI